ncbi:hypothetical protein DUNSADRAFT_8611 [Dunaliella salina]|uniref:Peptidase M50 domain-containing protein n=1 Tax=Dunaliella salina TaxID=3046 RepID=A0ABQ7H5T7_DUNSA|nr:hypothetical protein DUNSADRAFT_8611 [Dunaliella salina]|eukprot:KAF5842211.1 hypothetical protein DUNSADRAFT_8611 [Dunaliella salina]
MCMPACMCVESLDLFLLQAAALLLLLQLLTFQFKLSTSFFFQSCAVLFFFTLVVQLLGSIYYGAWHVLLWFLLLGPVLLSTVLFHELGHCLAARSVGGVVHGILLWCV